MKKKTGRKTISFILTLAMVFSMLTGIMPGMSLTAYADGTIEGSGTQESPFSLKTKEDLVAYASDAGMINPNDSEPTYISIDEDISDVFEGPTGLSLHQTVNITKDTVFLGDHYISFVNNSQIIMADGADVTIDGTTINNTKNNPLVVSGDSIVKSGTVGGLVSYGSFSILGGRVYDIKCYGNGEISGGTIYGAITTDSANGTVGNVTITGGTFEDCYNTDKMFVQNQGSIVIEGGRYNKEAVTKEEIETYLADGCCVIENGDYYEIGNCIQGEGTEENPFIIKSEDDLAEYAEDGTLVNPDSSEPTYVSINNDFTLSNTVEISKDTVFVGTGIVTLSKRKYISMADRSSASLTIDGPTFINNLENAISGSPTGAVTVKSGSVGAIQSIGPFTMTGGSADVVYCCGNGSISGGTVGTLLIDEMHGSEPNVEITGGTFNGSSDVPKAIFKNEGSLVIKGGKYKKTAISNLETDLKVYLAEGYSVTEEGDYYVVCLHPDKPTNVSAVNCTSADNNDGKLTGVTTAMEYKLSTAENWTDGTGEDITGLVPGTYYVRVKATETSLASDNLELTIGEYIAPISYVYYTEDGIIATKHTDGNCTDYTTVTDSTTDWSTGWYVVSSDVTISDRITVDGTANLILCDGATLTAEKGIEVNGTNELNIYAQDNGTGVINATGEEHYAGIGGSELYAGGILTIHGGIINATGGILAAGIGGGINGGVGTVTIYGGDVTANGGGCAAGIGSGCSEISDGVSGTVTIFGGTVKAIGNSGGAGIGGSESNNASETPIAVTINGGNVTATGGDFGGAGIGGGFDSGGNNVIINGGMVIANGASNAMGIGRGRSCEYSNGNLTLGEGMKMLVSTDNSTWSDYENDSRTRYMKALYTYSVTVTPGDNMTKTEASGSVTQTGLYGAMTDVVYTADEGYYFPEDYNVDAVNGISVNRDSYTQITVSGTPDANAEITLSAATAKTTPDKPTNVSAVNCTSADNNDGKLTGVTTAMEYKLSTAENWIDGTGSDITGLVPGTYYVRVKATETSLASDNLELTIREYIEPIPYVYYTEDGIIATKHTDGNCTDYTTVTDSTTDWSTGWYVVSSDVTVSERIFVEGTANLILCDGATLTAEKGIRVNDTSELNIYAQDNGTGALSATGSEYCSGIGGEMNENGGTVTIHGGTINANGGENSTGIGGGYTGSGGTVTIYSGNVNANGGKFGAGIGSGYQCQSNATGGTVTIFGGTVTAIGNYGGAGIGSGDSNMISGTSGVVTINGGTVTTIGNFDGAGIGGGSGSAGCKVTINGGTVIAYGDYGGMGIGRGACCEYSNGDLILGKGMKMLVSTDNSTWSDYDDKNDIRTPYMKSVEPHTHNFTDYTLSADGKTVTAICDADDCPIPEVDDKHTATLTIDAPALTTYGGSQAPEVVITDEYGMQGSSEVNYYATDKNGNKTGDPLTAAPTDAGTYLADVSIGTGEGAVVAHVKYTINKANTETPTIETAGFSVNYSAETFTLNDGYEASSSASEDGIFTGNSLTAILDSETDIPEIYIRKAATNNTNASGWLEVALGARPEAPTGLTTKEATNSDTADGKINGTTSSMEYSSDNGETWTDASDVATLVKPGTYLVRIKATSTVPAGKAASVEVGNKLKDILANTIEKANNYLDEIKGNDDYNAVELALSAAIATATETNEKSNATDSELIGATNTLDIALNIAEYNVHCIDKKKDADDLAKEGDSQACKNLISLAKAAIDSRDYDETKSLDENKSAIDAIISQLKSDLDAQRLAEAKDAAKTELAAYRNSFDDSLYDEDGVSELNKAKTDGDTAIDAVTKIEDITDVLKTAKENIDKVMTIDQKAANYVISLIDALPEPIKITWENIGDYEDDISSATDAYDRLTDNQKALIDDDRQKKIEGERIAKTIADAKNRLIDMIISDRDKFDNNLYDAEGIAKLDSLRDEFIDNAKNFQTTPTKESAQELIDTEAEMYKTVRKEMLAVDTISQKNAKAELEAKYDAMKNSGDYDEEGLDELKDAYNTAVDAIDAATVSDTKDDPKEKGAWQAEQEGEEALDAVKNKEEKDKEALKISKVLSEISAKTGDDTYYTGKQVELVNKPTTSLPDGYSLEYAVSTSNTEPASGWSTKTPAATEIGSYNVWCRVVEDKKNKVVASKNLTADINAKPSKGTITTDGIYCASNYPSIQAGISIHKSNENDGVEYRWVACDSGKPGEWFEVSPWTKDNNWIDWTPEKSGEYVIVCYARVVGNEEESEIQSSFGTVFHKKIKGICQMPYSGEGGGHLIGIESFDNPDNSYEYEMLILDCNLLIQNKDPWVYTTGRCKTPSNCLWTVWQPQYGYFWTLFRLYDADGNMIDELCYGFANVY